MCSLMGFDERYTYHSVTCQRLVFDRCVAFNLICAFMLLIKSMCIKTHRLIKIFPADFAEDKIFVCPIERQETTHKYDYFAHKRPPLIMPNLDNERNAEADSMSNPFEEEARAEEDQKRKYLSPCPNPALSRGKRCVVTGLESRRELNNHTGRVVGWLAEKERYQVAARTLSSFFSISPNPTLCSRRSSGQA